MNDKAGFIRRWKKQLKPGHLEIHIYVSDQYHTWPQNVKTLKPYFNSF